MTEFTNKGCIIDLLERLVEVIKDTTEYPYSPIVEETQVLIEQLKASTEEKNS